VTLPKAKIRLVHIITGLKTGGAEMMLYKLLSHIDRNKFDCQVISLTDKGVIGPKIEALGIPVFSVGMRNGLPAPIGFFRLVNQLKKHQPDIVQTWLYHADFLGGLAAKLIGVKKIIWNIRNSNIDASINKWHTRMTARVCGLSSSWLADAIISNSERATQVHQALGYKKALFHQIGNGFDLARFCPDDTAKSALCKQLDVPEETQLIGLVARFDPQKNHQNFIKAAGFIAKKIVNIRFILVGTDIDRHNKQLQKWIEETRYSDHFLLLGERNDIPHINAALDIACSSSLGESFPNAIGEAMACCVPCLVTDVGDLKKLVGDTGFVVPTNDPEALANATIELLNKPETVRQNLGKLARQRIEKSFSIKLIVSEYEQLYCS
jgi:glycosyltransferase involved in cell wall biosynthesis